MSKYGDHLPLHRQESIFARHGVELSRKTMCDWMRQCAELVGPLVDLMKERVLSSKVVQTDDTPVPVLDPELPRTTHRPDLDLRRRPGPSLHGVRLHAQSQPRRTG